MLHHMLALTNDPLEVRILKTALSPSKDLFKIEWLILLSSGIERLSVSNIDAIIVNLSSPDGSGIETFDKLFAAVPKMSFIRLRLTSQYYPNILSFSIS